MISDGHVYTLLAVKQAPSRGSWETHRGPGPGPGPGPALWPLEREREAETQTQLPHPGIEMTTYPSGVSSNHS